MIEGITIKFGRTPNSARQEIPTPAITVFVGPNNSGKSIVLNEIFRFCQNGPQGNQVVIDDIVFSDLTEQNARNEIKRIQRRPRSDEAISVGNIIVGSGNNRQQINEVQTISWMQTPNQLKLNYCQYFLRHVVLMLGGQTRINLINPQPAGDLQSDANTSFQHLFRDDIKRNEVRRIIKEAFGNFFVIDPTELGQFKIRFSPITPIDNMIERGIHSEAVDFHSNAIPVTFASDGVKAFTGIITEIIAGDPKIILIDEPEAFLHPSLAEKLGKEISKAATGSNKKIFASTHSSFFLIGCIQSGIPVNVVRLTYKNDVATSRVLPSNEILELMRNPLLRSTGVISGLFYESVIITESDSDRAFYQEINERLLRFKPDWGIPNCLFLNAQNKQTVQTIIAPLRKLGIPAAGVIDVDILKEGGEPWRKLMSSASIPAITIEGFSNIRARLKTSMENSGQNMKADGGIDILNNDDREAAINLFNQLAEYGIFVVQKGELESWLKDRNIPGHGPNWLIKMFESLGEDSESADFVKPGDGDVWEFIFRIKTWLTNPARKGIPD